MILIQYRNTGGRSRRLTISGHGRLTAEQARDQAKQLLAAAARGQDLAEERHRALRAPTVAQLATLLPADLDLYTEATRRALYDLLVAVHFTAPAAVKRGDWYPDYSPDEAGLVVLFARRRWLALWTRLEEATSELPESRREAIVRIQAAPEASHGATSMKCDAGTAAGGSDVSASRGCRLRALPHPPRRRPGDQTTRAEDLRFTRQMVHAAAVVGVNLLDHLVLGAAGQWESLFARGGW